MVTSSPSSKRAREAEVRDVIRTVFPHLPPEAIVGYKPGRGRIDVVFGEHFKLVIVYGEDGVWTRTMWYLYHFATREMRSASREECQALLRQERDALGATLRVYVTALLGPDVTTKPGS